MRLEARETRAVRKSKRSRSQDTGRAWSRVPESRLAAATKTKHQVAITAERSSGAVMSARVLSREAPGMRPGMASGTVRAKTASCRRP